MNYKKENGAYYTPEYIADYIVHEIFNEFSFETHNLRILEPSCGDGIFIKSLKNNSIVPKEVTFNIDIVEKNKEELEKAKLSNKQKNDHHIVNYFNSDFLDYDPNNKLYDIIIGNPPYLNKKMLTEQQKRKSEILFSDHKLDTKGFKNIWMSFILKSMSMLSDKGILAFVLPSELLQVNYANELRKYLFKNFIEIKIFIFNDLIFEKIEQDVVILIASKIGKKKSIDYIQVNNLNEIRKKVKLSPYSSISWENGEKWSNYLLSNVELEFIGNVNKHFKKVNDYCLASAGIVTAANDYFIINKEKLIKLGFEDIGYPILKKSSYLPKGINLTQEDVTYLQDQGLPFYLLFFNRDDVTEYHGQERKYLELGLKQEIHMRYKTRKRLHWFKVPFLEPSEGVFFKRSHLYPRIMVNSAKVLNTDSGYRIFMKSDFNIQSFVFSFYNSLTLLMSELNGRFYGGGVLELTPNEFKSLTLPYHKVSQEEFNHLDNMFKNNVSLEDILSYTDEVVLMRHLSKDEIYKIRLLRTKLVKRRLKEVNLVPQA